MAYDFSIIIPTYNRPDQLAQCLKSLADQDFPPGRMEIIVVDDGSPVSSKPIIQCYHRRINIRLIKQKNCGPASARNNGAQYAQGDYLVFVDDDCKPERNWLSVVKRTTEGGDRCLIGGRVVNSIPENIYSATSQLITDLVYAHYNSDPQHARFLSSSNICMHRDDYAALGGFNCDFRTAEDRDLCDRWLMSGRRMIYTQEAICLHAHSLAILSFWKLYVSYGQGAWTYSRANMQRRQGRMRIEIDKYRTFLRLLPQALAPYPRLRAVKIVVLLMVWQIANAVGFLTAALQRK